MNDKADLIAKSALDLASGKFKIPSTDLKSKINRFLHTKWQQRLNYNIHNKFFLIKSTLNGGIHSEDSERNKSLYHNYALVTQDLDIPLNSNKNNLIIYKGNSKVFQTFFVWALLLIVHTWNSSLLPSNLPRLQCTCCTVTTTSRRPHGSPLVWAQPLSSPQLSNNDSL